MLNASTLGQMLGLGPDQIAELNNFLSAENLTYLRSELNDANARIKVLGRKQSAMHTDLLAQTTKLHEVSALLTQVVALLQAGNRGA